MDSAKGIDTHQVFRLGKSQAQKDDRNLQFKKLLRAPLEALPEEYDFDVAHSGIPTPMFANDRKGNCVIAARAHHTLRFEFIEQGKVIKISDQEVISEYLSQTGGSDSGLVMLDSLKQWRRKGWVVGNQRYTIKAFAEADITNREEIRQAIFIDIGLEIGLLLPLSAKKQIDAGKPWEPVSGPEGEPNSWGGHCVFISGYTKAGPVCVTWGRKQQMTWRFLSKYCDEAYVVFDALNSKKIKELLAVSILADFLETHPAAEISTQSNS